MSRPTLDTRHHEVSFARSPTEERLIRKIVSRSAALAAKYGQPFDRVSRTMDIIACHANGCPLDLKRLLAADDFNFAHDVGGIYRHLCRETGTLQDHFRPRFARKGA